MPQPPLRPAPERFAEILHALGWAVAKQTGWGLSLQLIAVIAGRIRRIKQGFAALAARIAAGTYRPRAADAAPRRTPENPPKPPPPNPLPNNPGWLLPLERDAVAHRAQLEHLFQDAEMLALMAAAPEAMARVLRPLCRMLALDLPPVLAKPVLARPKPAASVAAARPPRARPVPTVRPPPPHSPRPWTGPPPPPPGLTLEFDIWGDPRLVWT